MVLALATLTSPSGVCATAAPSGESPGGSRRARTRPEDLGPARLSWLARPPRAPPTTRPLGGPCGAQGGARERVAREPEAQAPGRVRARARPLPVGTPSVPDAPVSSDLGWRPAFFVGQVPKTV